MKIRQGLVSNSSSSSFIIRKNALTTDQLKQVTDLLYARRDSYTTEFEEDNDFIEGYVEAHNGLERDRDVPLSELLSDLVKDKFRLGPVDYLQKYEEDITREDLNKDSHRVGEQLCFDFFDWP